LPPKGLLTKRKENAAGRQGTRRALERVTEPGAPKVVSFPEEGAKSGGGAVTKKPEKKKRQKKMRDEKRE